MAQNYPEINPHRGSQLILNKGTKALQKKKGSSFQEMIQKQLMLKVTYSMDINVKYKTVKLWKTRAPMQH